MSVKVLDCTLRDGGYVNNFAFGEDSAKKIISGLVDSGLEYVEVGFFRNAKSDTETTVFTSFYDVEHLLPNTKNNSKYFAMIVYGTFDIDKIPMKSQTKIDGIRVTFKKKEIDEALAYIKKIQEKGYIVSANPTGVHQYADNELLTLIGKINQYNPDIFAIVDTLGLLKSDELLRIFYLVNHNLNESITIAFHSHNNLQLSFSNAQALLASNTKRELIIDASVRGMGRGAGNLCTELLLQYLNDNFDKKYNLIPILKIIDEQIDKIYATNPWGYNVPYYLAASMKCHPNYASFLTDKASISVESMSEILALIPENKKSNYDEKLIQELYLCYQENEINDTHALENLKNNVANRDVLIIAPGKSINLYKDKILSYIKEKKPYVISINFRPEAFDIDNVFISNARRFSEQTSFENVLVTSNIKAENVITFNYGSYLNNSEMADNSCLMLLKILLKAGIKKVIFAGMDGFSNGNDNYFNVSMINNAKLGEFDKRNEVMSQMLKSLAKSINMTFLTPSLYEKEHEVQSFSVGY